MPIDPRKLVVGDQVPGTRWVVCRKLGAGGMGVVFEVVLPPGVRGAMKIMLPHMASRREFVEGFLQEVRITARLQHRNIVRVTFFEELADGTLYYIMELLDGSTLRQTMELHREPLKPAIVYEIIRQVCAGLERAHEAGVVHRDLKPENVFLHAPEGDEATVKVGDFGIAVLHRDERARGINGTPKYMSPEQFLDQRVSPRTDVYALGLMTYEMLTGRFPFDPLPKDVATMREQHLKGVPIAPSSFVPTISRDLDALLLSAIAKRPEDRPASALEFSNRLFQLTWSPGLPLASTEPTFETLARLVRRQGAPTDAGASASMSAGTFFGMSAPPVDGRSVEVVPESTMAADAPPMVTAGPALSEVLHFVTTVPGSDEGVGPLWNSMPMSSAPGRPVSVPPGAPNRAGVSQVTARLSAVPGVFSPPLASPAASPLQGTDLQRSDAALSNSVSRSTRDPVTPSARRSVYRAIVLVPVLALANLVVLLVLLLVRSRAPESPPSPAALPIAATVASPPIGFSIPARSASSAASSGPAIVVPSATPAASASSVVPATHAPPVRRAPPAAYAAPTKPTARPPRDDGRDLLPGGP